MTQTIILTGLTCGACQKIIQKRLGKIDGVTQVDVTLETGGTVITARRMIEMSEIRNALIDTKYLIT